jgi:NAD(P)-dependent dehydrogenase (short-subunit alcohol dehydrogenase family)
MAKTVLITGASSGFGRGASLFFKEKGWNVAATMRSPEKARAWAEPASLYTPKMDVTDYASMQSVVEEVATRFGGIDVLINNAGFGMLGPLEGAAFDDIKRQFDTNVMGVIALTQLVLPHMRAAGSGVIVNISSVGGRVTFPLYATYHATKFAMEGLTEALQYELVGQGTA